MMFKRPGKKSNNAAVTSSKRLQGLLILHPEVTLAVSTSCTPDFLHTRFAKKVNSMELSFGGNKTEQDRRNTAEDGPQLFLFILVCFSAELAKRCRIFRHKPTNAARQHGLRELTWTSGSYTSDLGSLRRRLSAGKADDEHGQQTARRMLLP